MFFSGGADGAVRVWDAGQMRPAVSFEVGELVYDVQMSPCTSSGALLASASSEPGVRLLDLRTGSSAHILPGYSGVVRTVRWSPNHQHCLLSGGLDGHLKLWDVRRGCIATCRTDPRLITSLLSSRSSSTPLSSSSAPSSSFTKARPRKLARGRLHRDVDDSRGAAAAAAARGGYALAHYGPVAAALWHPSGAEFFSLGGDLLAHRWSATDGSPLQSPWATLPRAPASPDGACMARQAGCVFLASGPVIRLLDSRTSAELTPPLKGHFSEVVACAYNPGLDELYSLDKDGLAVVWRPPRPSLPAPSSFDTQDNWSDQDDYS